MKSQRSRGRKDKTIRVKEFFSFIVSVLIVTAVWILFTWQRLQVVWLGNQVSAGLKTIRQLEDTNRSLKLRRAGFRSLSHVTHRASKELGMGVVLKGQLVVLDERWDSRP